MLPEDGCILVYYKPFEQGRLEELGERFPRKNKQIQKLIGNMVDLLDPFKARHLYSWKQRGSHSLKAVLPALVKDLSYDDLEIADGGAAMQAYHEMGTLVDSPRKLVTLRKQLLAYCKQDTMATVRLVDVLNRMSQGL